MKKLGLALVLCAAIVGCTNPYISMRDNNRTALNKVEIGMPRSQVEEIMGQQTADAGAGKFENPYKREIIRGSDGRSYDVLYYYTQEIGNQPIETGRKLTGLVDRS